MINLHALARVVVPAVHPDEDVVLRQSLGQTNVRGEIVPIYAPARTARAQIQSLSSDELKNVEGTARTEIHRKAYLCADAALPPQGIVRPLARGGDMLQRADGTWWLVTQMIEDFTGSGWVAVRITQQIMPPDLSATPELLAATGAAL